jgi:putative membrane protein
MNLILNKNYVKILLALFVLEFGLLAIDPNYRAEWVLENILVVVILVILVVTYRKFPLSKISYTLVFIFLCLHEIGSHYTYAEVPYDDWFKSVFGITFNDLAGWQRNNFDRVVHFSYGLLLAYPLREIFLRIADVKGFWGYFLPFDLTVSTSALYELIEWAVAELHGGELGMAYLGIQGDIWDSHKDMALASLGALIAMTVAASINSYHQRDFGREWNQSLKIKHPVPLGEE